MDAKKIHPSHDMIPKPTYPSTKICRKCEIENPGRWDKVLEIPCQG